MIRAYRHDHIGRNFVAMQTGGQVYVFLWDDGRHREAIQRACAMADNPELSFTWCDARKFARRARELAKEAHRAQ